MHGVRLYYIIKIIDLLGLTLALKNIIETFSLIRYLGDAIVKRHSILKAKSFSIYVLCFASP